VVASFRIMPNSENLPKQAAPHLTEAPSAFSEFPSLYKNYASTHAGVANPDADRVLTRDFLRHIPRSAQRILDLGCGQGQLVRLCQTAGFPDTYGVDISPEQLKLGRTANVSNLILGDAFDVLTDMTGQLDVVLACDFVEHLPRDAVLALFAAVVTALRPGGMFIGRTPNGNSPFHGFYYHGDLTHRSLLTPRSLHQVASNSGFSHPQVFPCPPVPHGPTSLARVVAWQFCEAVIKVAMRIETGLATDVITQNLVFTVSRPCE